MWMNNFYISECLVLKRSTWEKNDLKLYWLKWILVKGRKCLLWQGRNTNPMCMCMCMFHLSVIQPLYCTIILYRSNTQNFNWSNGLEMLHRWHDLLVKSLAFDLHIHQSGIKRTKWTWDLVCLMYLGNFMNFKQDNYEIKTMS